MTETMAIADDLLYEVIDGRIVEKPSMGTDESLIATALAAWIYQWGGRTIGRVVNEGLFLLDAARPLKRRPDVAFVSYERWPRHKPRSTGDAWEVVPDLAVEVVSPSNSANEIDGKVVEYFQAGVRLVWVIYPISQRIYVFSSKAEIQVLESGDELDGGNVIPGFRMPVKTLFGDED